MVHHLYFDLAPANASRSVTRHPLDRDEPHWHWLQGLPMSHDPASPETAPHASVTVWSLCDLFRFALEAGEAATSKAKGPKARRG